MHYPETPGFRASTAFSFRFYDLGDEQQTPLNIHPICMCEDHLRKQNSKRKIHQLYTVYKSKLNDLKLPFVVLLTAESFNIRSKNKIFLSTIRKLMIHGKG